MSIPLIEKTVSESFPIGLTYVDPDLETGETIVSVTAAVTPTGLTLASTSYVGARVSTFVSGGAVGTEYTVLFKVTTSSGKIFNNPYRDAILVKVI